MSEDFQPMLLFFSLEINSSEILNLAKYHQGKVTRKLELMQLVVFPSGSVTCAVLSADLCKSKAQLLLVNHWGFLHPLLPPTIVFGY